MGRIRVWFWGIWMVITCLPASIMVVGTVSYYVNNPSATIELESWRFGLAFSIGFLFMAWAGVHVALRKIEAKEKP